jgi:WD40 repeat protein
MLFGHIAVSAFGGIMTKRIASAWLLMMAANLSTAEIYAQAKDADRREFYDAGLVLETGVRTGACDVLTFTPDGKSLLATGDDKVVRAWKWDKNELDVLGSQALRWPVFREHRGNIFAMAVSTKKNHLVAVGGWGVRDGSVAVLDRMTNQVAHGLTQQQLEPGNVTHTIWAITFSPSGDKVAYGTDRGSIWLWDLASGKKNDVKFVGRHAARAGKLLNKVKFLHFDNEDQLLSVAQDGHVLQWTPSTGASRELLRFDSYRKHDADVYAVARSPDGKWLAASGEGAYHLEVRSLIGARKKILAWPGARNYVHCLAFDATGKRLAVGVEAITQNHRFSGEPFSEVTGGKVYLYDLTEVQPTANPGPSTSHYPEAIAFHPTANQLAVAGGNDHEVALWDLDPLRKVSETPIIGQSIWGVGLTKDGAKLCFRDKRADDPVHPNRRSHESAPYRVFDLQKRKFDPGGKNVAPVQPLETLGGWKVVPDPGQRWVWHVANAQGKRFAIPLDERDGMPRCYSFLKSAGDDVRLAVGHFWGISVYALTPNGPIRLRLFNGHQGETMALAPSDDGKTLVSSSRDQTVIGWSLTDWPSHPELGARFLLKQGKIMVDSVDAGSPCWEAGLQEGDEVVIFRYRGFEFLYDPYRALAAHVKLFKHVGNVTECMDLMNKPVPGKEFYFRVVRPGTKAPVEMVTTVRQRPVWRFFPTKDGEWVMWRWRDFFYDTSDRGDSYLGWQLSRDADETPRFYKAEQYRQRYHRPEKLSEGFKDVEHLAFASIEPPLVRIDGGDRKVKDADVMVSATVTPSGERKNQQLSRVLWWVNDYKLKEIDGPFTEDKALELELMVPRDKLRQGPNQLTLQAYNEAGGRSETSVEVFFVTNAKLPRLFGLFVGVGDYAKATPPQRGLQGGRDARGLADAWGKLKDRPYESVDIRQLIDGDVSADAVLKQLKSLAENVRPDDLFVFYLGGHGIDSTELLKVVREGNIKLGEAVLPGEFWFCGPRFELTRPSKDGLRAKDVYHALANLPCRKLVLLDACHSGSLAGKASGPLHGNPVRPLSADGVGPIILAACQPRESAWEDAVIGLQDVDGRAFGLFAISLLMGLEQDFDRADRNKNTELDGVELADFVRTRVPQMFKLNVQQVMPSETQTPTVMVPLLEQRLQAAIAQKKRLSQGK